jgi:hypothetical protein
VRSSSEERQQGSCTTQTTTLGTSLTSNAGSLVFPCLYAEQCMLLQPEPRLVHSMVTSFEGPNFFVYADF